LSLLQQQMWSLEITAPAPGFYNDSIRHRFDEPVDVPLLGEALQYVVDRHESLRTRFPTDATGPYQSILPSMTVDLAVTDLRGPAAGDRSRELGTLVSSEHQNPFDVARGPVFRARLFLLDGGGGDLSLTLHHLISDETSLSLLLADLLDAYRDLRAGEKPRDLDLGIQYADFAVWESRWFTNKRRVAQSDYWMNKLGGLAPFRALPYSEAEPAAVSAVDLSLAPDLEDFVLADDLRAGLVRLARACRTGLSVVCLAAVESLMTLSTGDVDTVVMTTYAGRDRPELQQVVGLFGGVGFLRTDLSGDPAFEVVLRRARASMLGLLENHHLPVVEVIEMLAAAGTDLDLQRVPVAFHFFHAAERWEPGTTVVARPPAGDGPADDPDAAAKPLDFRFYDDGHRLWCRLGYHAGCFEPGVIDVLIGDLRRLLEAVATDPLLRLSDLPVTPVPITPLPVAG